MGFLSPISDPVNSPVKASIAAAGGVPDVTDSLILNLRSDQGTTVDGGDLITQWDDQSGSGYQFTRGETSGPLVTTSSTNGKTTVRSTDTGNERLSLATDTIYIPDTQTGATIICVAEPTAAQEQVSFVFDFGNIAATGYGLAISTNNIQGYTPTGSGGAQTQAAGSYSGIVYVAFRIPFSGTQELFIDDWTSAAASNAITLTQLTAGEINEATEAARSTTNGPPSLIGSSKDSNPDSRNFIGDLFQLRIYNKSLSNSELATVKTKMVSLWG